MPTEEKQNHQPNGLLRILVPLLSSDFVEMIAALWRLGKRILAARTFGSPYELLEYEARLELLDTKGHKAVLYKHEQVRFLQNNVIAFQDQAWGDGNIFADYKCSPGVPVDRYREGHRYRVLISLHETKNRGDLMDFTAERTILRGFTASTEEFQNEVDHPMHHYTISVVFPRGRFPKYVTLIERNATRTMPLGSAHQQMLPDGRQKVIWTTTKPRLFEIYILHWEW